MTYCATSLLVLLIPFTRTTRIREVFCIYIFIYFSNSCRLHWGGRSKYFSFENFYIYSQFLVYFLRTEIQSSHSVPSQDYTAVDLSNRCSRCVKARIVMVKSDPSSVVGCPDFLLFTFALIRGSPRFINCYYVIDVIRSAFDFLTFLSTNRHEPFFERLTNCDINNIFTVKCANIIECVLVPLMPMPNDLPISVCAQQQ